MAIMSKCVMCDEMVSHSASGIPLCDEHSGRNAAIKAEHERWSKLTVSEKLDELKTQVDGLIELAKYIDAPYE